MLPTQWSVAVSKKPSVPPKPPEQVTLTVNLSVLELARAQCWAGALGIRGTLAP
jgi:hypothetical protein